MRYVKMENGRVVNENTQPIQKIQPKSRATRTSDRWSRFQVKFLEVLGLMMAFAILGTIAGFFILIFALTVMKA